MEHDYEIIGESVVDDYQIVVKQCSGCLIVLIELRLRYPEKRHVSATECTHPESALYDLRSNEEGVVIGYTCEDCGSMFEYSFALMPQIEDKVPLSNEIETFLENLEVD